MKTVFKAGDKVFDMNHGWGVVYTIYSEGLCPIFVKFMVSTQCYTLDGRLYHQLPPSLSFTEYTLQGFSQERPVVLPKVGELVLVSDDSNGDWVSGEFKAYKNNKYYIDGGSNWKYCKRFKFIEE